MKVIPRRKAFNTASSSKRPPSGEDINGYVKPSTSGLDQFWRRLSDADTPSGRKKKTEKKALKLRWADGDAGRKINPNVLFGFVGRIKVGIAVAKHVTDRFSAQIRDVRKFSVAS